MRMVIVIVDEGQAVLFAPAPALFAPDFIFLHRENIGIAEKDGRPDPFAEHVLDDRPAAGRAAGMEEDFPILPARDFLFQRNLRFLLAHASPVLSRWFRDVRPTRTFRTKIQIFSQNPAPCSTGLSKYPARARRPTLSRPSSAWAFSCCTHMRCPSQTVSATFQTAFTPFQTASATFQTAFIPFPKLYPPPFQSASSPSKLHLSPFQTARGVPVSRTARAFSGDFARDVPVLGTAGAVSSDFARGVPVSQTARAFSGDFARDVPIEGTAGAVSSAFQKASSIFAVSS